MPKTRQDLLDCLDALEITHSTVDHAPVFTVAESQSLRDEIPGGHTKNLFLKDKKGAYFLVTLEENAEVNLKTIHTLIGASGRVSFGKPEALMEKLGVTPGSVTIFCAINDPDHEVTIVIDAPLLENEVINAHPLSNDATTSIGRDESQALSGPYRPRADDLESFGLNHDFEHRYLPAGTESDP
jgi:Ala-tRNA(Pro) deacylase